MIKYHAVTKPLWDFLITLSFISLQPINTNEKLFSLWFGLLGSGQSNQRCYRPTLTAQIGFISKLTEFTETILSYICY